MQPRITTRPAFTVVGLRITTRPMTPEIPALWGAFVPRIGELPDIAEPQVSYGLMSDLDQLPGQMDYMAGVAVRAGSAVPAGMSRWEVPANTYAVFDATLTTIGQVFEHIYSVWLPRGEHARGAGPHFERYGEDFDMARHPVLSLWVPVQAQR